MNRKSKIIRTWKGLTTWEYASIYENMLIKAVFPTVKRNGVTRIEMVYMIMQEQLISNRKSIFKTFYSLAPLTVKFKG